MALAVAHVCRTAWPALGGLEAAVHGLARSLVGRGHASWVVTLGGDGDAYEGVPYRRLRRLGPRRYPTALGLRRAVRDADVVHVHGLDGLADMMVALRRLGRVPPVCVSTHGGYLHTPWMRTAKQIWLRTGTRLTLRGADAVWFTSASDQRRLGPCRAVGPVLEDGVDLASLTGAVRSPQPGLWVAPGRIDVHKGHADLIEVVAQLATRERAPDEVRIVGPESSPGLVQQLIELARRRGVGSRIRFTGAVSRGELARALAHCSLAVFPSHREGFGIGTVEAMGAGAPVALADIDAFQDRVVHGVHGWKVPWRSPERAAAMVDNLPVGVERARVAERGRLRARRWGWARRVRAFEAAYWELAS